MKIISKSEIVRLIHNHLSQGKPMDDCFIHKQSGKIVSVKIDFVERDSYIDENGVKWVRT
jgi:hypothetical protein